jgi:hypothetical protein
MTVHVGSHIYTSQRNLGSRICPIEQKIERLLPRAFVTFLPQS